MNKLTLEQAKKMTPKGFWQAFYEIAQIPHGTYNCQKLSQFLAEKYAKYPGCKVEKDEADNLLVRVRPSKGCEPWPSICIQGHMDMVCAKAHESKHDFKKDPIEIIVDGDKVHANKTTLGADDAVAIATTFAILESGKPHGPLEFLITVDEEESMDGVQKLKDNIVQSPYFICLDIEDPSIVCIGCKGALVQEITFDVTREKATDMRYLWIHLKNLKGGHSGEFIDYKRMNAIKVIFDILYNLVIKNGVSAQIINVDGGIAKNAIPTFCDAYLAVKPNQLNKAKKIIQDMFQQYLKEYDGYDTPDFSVSEVKKVVYQPIKKKRSDEIILAYTGMVNGIDVYDREHQQAESSLSLGIVKTNKDSLFTSLYARSMYRSAMERMCNNLAAVVQLAHGTQKQFGYCPSWRPAKGHNPLLDEYLKEFKKVSGISAKSTIATGSVEVTIAINHNPNIKYTIACGPRIDGYHTRAETTYIRSVQENFEAISHLIDTVNVWGK